MVTTQIGQLKNILYRQITEGQYRTGQKLPPVRELAKKHNVSSVTVNLAIAELKSLGLVRVKRGAGTFVAYDPKADHETQQLRIGVAYLDFYRHHIDRPSGSHPTLIQWLRGIHDHFSEDRASIKPLCYQKLKLADTDSPVRRAIERKQIDALIVTGWLTPEEADYLTRNRIPFVVVEHLVPDRQVATVMVSRTLAFRMLVSHLVQLGHQKIVFLTYASDQNIYHYNGQPYVRAAHSAGCNAFSSDDILILNDLLETFVTQDKYIRCINEVLSRIPTAVIVFDDAMASRLLRACIKRNIRIPEMLSIASIVNSLPGTQIFDLTTTNMFSLLPEVARLASELLDRGLHGEEIGTENVLITPSLVMGESTGPAGDSAGQFVEQIEGG